MTAGRVRSFALGVALASGVAAWRSFNEGRMPYLDSWRPALAERHGASVANSLSNRVRRHYDEFYAARPLPLLQPAAFRRHYGRVLLPGMALYATLGEAMDSGAALAETAALMESVTSRAWGPLESLVGALTMPVPAMRPAVRQLLPRLLPGPAWHTAWLEDSGERIVFTAHPCAYLRVLRHHRLPELTGLFFDLDEARASRFPRKLTLQRLNAAALTCCDPGEPHQCGPLRVELGGG